MRRAFAIVAAVALLATACGDDGDAGQAQTEEGAAEAVTSANEAILSGDVDGVFDFLSDACKEVVDEAEVRLAVSLIPAFFDDFFEDFDLADLTVTASVVSFDGDTAKVETAYIGPDESEIDSLGFSSDTITVIYENGKWVDSGCEFEDTTARDAEILADALDELGYAGTTDDPIPRSVAAPVGGGFVVYVNDINLDAFDEIAALSEFANEPEDGHTFVLINVTVGYVGPDEPESLGSVMPTLIGGSSKVGINNFGCGGFPGQLASRSAKMFVGGVTSGGMCFSVPDADVDGLLLSVEGTFLSDSGIIFDPTVEAGTPVPVTGSNGPVAEAAFTAARQDPSPLGSAVDLGEGWTMTVNGVDANGAAVALEASEFNEPPPEGFVYVLLDHELSYDGADASSSGFSVDVELVGNSNVSADSNCGVFGLPDEIDRFADVFQGGTISGTSCYLVDESDLDSLVVFASADFFSDDAFVLAVR